MTVLDKTPARNGEDTSYYLISKAHITPISKSKQK